MFSVQSDGAYVTYTPEGNADAVTKKLGSDISSLTEDVIVEFDIYTGPTDATTYDIDFENGVYIEVRIGAWTTNKIYSPHGRMYLDADTNTTWVRWRGRQLWHRNITKHVGIDRDTHTAFFL